MSTTPLASFNAHRLDLSVELPPFINVVISYPADVVDFEEVHSPADGFVELKFTMVVTDNPLATINFNPPPPGVPVDPRITIEQFLAQMAAKLRPRDSIHPDRFPFGDRGPMPGGSIPRLSTGSRSDDLISAFTQVLQGEGANPTVPPVNRVPRATTNPHTLRD